MGRGRSLTHGHAGSARTIFNHWTNAVGSPAMKGTLAVTGDNDADHLLDTDPLAPMIGMLLDQHTR